MGGRGDLNPAKTLLPAASRRSVPENPCAACPVRSLAICAALEPEQLGLLDEINQRVSIDAGATLIAEGDPAHHLFNVSTGTLRVHKLLPDGRRQIIGFLFAGDFVGLAVKQEYAYSVEAIAPSEICRFPRKDLEALLERFPKMGRELFARASDELAIAQDQMLLLGKKTARERVASMLLSLARRAELRGVKNGPIELPMTRNDIGDYLGLTTETVSRTFTKLRNEGLIETPPGHLVVIRDPEALGDAAEGG